MKDKIISISFIAFLFIVLLLNVIKVDEKISLSERRKLQQIPQLSMEGVIDTSFQEKFDKYVLDQFIFRDKLRTIKANVNYHIFKKLENNGIYIIDDYIFKSEYPTNIESINDFVDKINGISTYFTEENKVYYMIIPDKNYYSNDKKYLNVDYDLLYEKIKNINYQYIEVRDLLTLDDYYKTDTHWKQENLNKIVTRLGNVMGFEINTTYNKNTSHPFYGVYYGQASLGGEDDELIYLTNDTILNSKVNYYENKKENRVYPLDNLENLDKYDIFLDGASSFIEIKNPSNQTGRELVVFRDSFASSLTPLLLDAYSKITLIDTRYITSDIYLDIIEFNNQDILFLYSTLIVNNSRSLK